ncbi:hemerythrin domain-containing protein [Ulvibacter antarcticus]|uniref:Hemerythrin HHE cation binding domain-containing protein n=1 Tax=Ulvibacter antarcticus TaxID=442714 RepID=A0A3L9YL31_9FLAO|nr:hemerythrin domain-containing protein [Ulvibacter antarcticus]RMA58718.1 hemerythrin HHE cation binding domain-containing protein [Ulvibacter antarcticus]
MEKNKPIKRHEALRPLSRQHHFGLLYSWKIRKGFANGSSIERMKEYSNWFFKTEIKPHFTMEEKHIFPVLGGDNLLIKRALKEHRRLERLFNETEDPERSLSILEEELQAHIRFEERILFNEIQKVASNDQLQKIEDIHSHDVSKPEYKDPFWV